MSTAPALSCWSCGAGLQDIPLPISRHANCLKCYAALHCCRLCTQFDARRPGQCSEERAEPPNDKEVANFCEWFAPRGDAGVAHGTPAAAARAKLDALFTKTDVAKPAPATSDVTAPQSTATDQQSPTSATAAPSKADLARAELERLFGTNKPTQD